MAKIIGIDLGTTNSAVAYVGADGEPAIIENSEGNRTTPSVTALSKANERLVGLVAKRQAITNPKNTIFSVKRLIGRKWTDPEVKRDREWLPYELRESENGGVEIKMGDPSTGSGQVLSTHSTSAQGGEQGRTTGSGQAKWYKPEEISAMVLAKIKADAEMRLGEKIEEAVITVPAYFDDSQRQATKNAGEVAGFKVRRILNEPTAAALAYGLNKKGNEKIIVYDFGGGTFDVSVLEVGDDTVEVKSTGGDTHLGGDDFDKKINEYLVKEYKKQEGVDISKDPLALQRLKEAAERAKHELSSSFETEINLPYISSDAAGPKHFLMKITRAKLEELVKEYIDRSIELTKKTVEEAGFKTSDLDQIVLVGGQTRMPAIQEAVKKLFGKEPNRTINPDEVVALGAAIQAGIFQGDVKDILLLDVNPLTLSIETMGGVATPMILKNTTVPTAKTQIFSTAADSQTSVEIHVIQGERPMSADNKTLARFILDGLPPAPRGIPQVEVSFDIDANGILSVKAADKATGKSQTVRIEAQTALSKEEIEKLKREAAEHADEDKNKKDLVEAVNRGETLVYTAGKALADAGEKIPVELKSEIQEKIDALKKTIEGKEKETIESAIAELSAVIQRIGEAMYNKEDGKQPESGNSENSQ